MRVLPRTLRTRLVAALLVLATVGLAIAGTFSVLALRTYLTDQVDQRLVRFAGVVAVASPPPYARVGTPQVLPTDFRLALFDASGTALSAGDSQAGGPAIDASVLGAPGRLGQPTTVADSQGGAAWRTVAVAIPQGTAVIALPLASVDATVNQLLVIELVFGGAVLLMLAALGTGLVRIGLRPLTPIEQTASAIARGDLDRRIAHTDQRTEVGRLGAALNTMLGQISAAMRESADTEARLRQFVADASHELRTPLTSIRGFAELSGSPGITAAEVSRNLRRIEAEAERMGGLVDDLLLLANLDERRPLEPAPVDLLVLAVDAVDDARARHPERTIKLGGDMRSHVVSGDERRLRQVLANLINNAVLHTPPGTPVRVTLRPSASPLPLVAAAGERPGPNRPRAELEVRDFGQGIAAPDARHVFDRFYRGDPSRARATGGAGLGLSIAAAILAAHDGRLELRTAPGAGAAFRIVLPVRPAQRPQARRSEAVGCDGALPRSCGSCSTGSAPVRR